VSLQKLLTADGKTAPAFATVREDNNTILGMVGPSYRPLQNIEALNFFQPFIDSGAASLETAGSLKGGKRIWVLAKANVDDQVIVGKADDRVQMYVLVADGRKPIDPDTCSRSLR
jgi:hypothetical protein